MSNFILALFTIICLDCFAGNIRVGPIELIRGYFEGDVTFKVNDHMSMGPSLTYIGNRGSNGIGISGHLIGVRLNYFPTYMPIDDGIYLGAEFGHGNIEVEDSDLITFGEKPVCWCSGISRIPMGISRNS